MIIENDHFADDLEELAQRRPMTTAELTLALVSAHRRIASLDENLRRALENVMTMAEQMATMQATMADITKLMRKVLDSQRSSLPPSGGGNSGPTLMS